MPTTPTRARIAALATPKHVRGRTPDRPTRAPPSGTCNRCYTNSPRRPAPQRTASPRTPSRGGYDGSTSQGVGAGPGGVMRGYPNDGQRPSWVNLNPPNHALSAAVEHQPRGTATGKARVGRNRTMDPEWAIDAKSVLGGKGYPNWTLPADDAKGKRAQPPRPASPAPAAGDGADTRSAAKNPPRGLHRPGFRSGDHEMATYPNWTLGRRTPSPASTRRHTNLSNDDIEGSRPALTKFSRKSAQRIVADPYPDRATCPVKGGYHRETTHVITPDQPTTVTVRADVDAKGRPLPSGSPLYNAAEGTLRTKEVEQYRNGAYRTTEVVTERPLRGGAATPREAYVDPPRSPRVGMLREASANLRTSDIDGARPRSVGGYDTPPRGRVHFDPPGRASPSPAPRTPRRYDSPGMRSFNSPRAASSAAYHNAMQSQISFF